ncbi:zinc finger and SCAN domain-containing protein 12-like, partial [Notechis scutatus]|uniref:Zinc finger and SCAN domain-containing protein 12-like n=1 Tax=Notechis scutatus TaxID=8663 RepID=A0A6J1WAL5_9SAUR
MPSPPPCSIPCMMEEATRRSKIQPWDSRSLQYLEAEGPRGLCSQLHDFCRRWLRPGKHSKAQMLDLVVLEKLLALLPPEMEGWVQECGAETSSQAVVLAEGFLLSQAEEQKEQVDLQWCTVEIRDREGKKNPSNPPQELFFRRIPWEDPSQDTSGEIQRMKFSGFSDGAQRVVEPPNQVRKGKLIRFEFSLQELKEMCRVLSPSIFPLCLDWIIFVFLSDIENRIAQIALHQHSFL